MTDEPTTSKPAPAGCGAPLIRTLYYRVAKVDSYGFQTREAVDGPVTCGTPYEIDDHEDVHHCRWCDGSSLMEQLAYLKDGVLGWSDLEWDHHVPPAAPALAAWNLTIAALLTRASEETAARLIPVAHDNALQAFTQGVNHGLALAEQAGLIIKGAIQDVKVTGKVAE